MAQLIRIGNFLLRLSNAKTEIVDLLQGPRRVLSDHILAIPTLIKLSPAPVRKIIGDLSEEAKVLLALALQQRTT